MTIRNLEISGIRNLQSVNIEPSPVFNLIVGENGSGKTSMLEAIHLLGLGRSFRTNRLRRLIKDSESTGTVFALLENGHSTWRAGIMKQVDGTTQIRINGESRKTSAELARILPLQILHPESVVLLDGGPKGRRQFLDWGVFHVEHGFLDLWRSAQKVLKQRNSLLRNAKIEDYQIKAWDEQLLGLGAEIDRLRKGYFSQFSPVFTGLLEEFGGGIEVKLEYYPGWPESGFQDALQGSFVRDRQKGFTTCGPHKADLRVRHGKGAMANEILSRGQKKLLVTLLRLAQTRLFLDQSGDSCVVMMDDLPSEMDESARKRVCRLLADFGCQVFFTCIQEEALLPLLESNDVKVFHVEHGQVSVS